MFYYGNFHRLGGGFLSLFVMADLHLSLSVDKPMDIFGGWKDYVKKIKTEHLETSKLLVEPIAELLMDTQPQEAIENFDFTDM